MHKYTKKELTDLITGKLRRNFGRDVDEATSQQMFQACALVVRETGGLKDSVQPYNQYEDAGTGFSFANIDRGDMLHVLGCAVELWHTDKKAWKGLQKRGMTADFSWNRSAGDYETIYRDLTGQEA